MKLPGASVQALLLSSQNELARFHALAGVRCAMFWRVNRPAPTRCFGLVRVITMARAVNRRPPPLWMRHALWSGLMFPRGVVLEAPAWVLLPYLLWRRVARWRRR